MLLAPQVVQIPGTEPGMKIITVSGQQKALCQSRRFWGKIPLGWFGAGLQMGKTKLPSVGSLSCRLISDKQRQRPSTAVYTSRYTRATYKTSGGFLCTIKNSENVVHTGHFTITHSAHIWAEGFGGKLWEFGLFVWVAPKPASSFHSWVTLLRLELDPVMKNLPPAV